MGAARGSRPAAPHLLRGSPGTRGCTHGGRAALCCRSPAPGLRCQGMSIPPGSPGLGGSAGASLARSALRPTMRGCCWLCLSWLRWVFSCMRAGWSWAEASEFINKSIGHLSGWC